MPILALTLWIGFLTSTNVVAVKILLKTKFEGLISIDDRVIKHNEKLIPFENISLLTLKPYITRSRSSYIPRWKLCDELEIKLKDDSVYRLLISEDNPPLTIPIFEILERIKMTNAEYNNKIELPNRTAFFTREDKKHST